MNVVFSVEENAGVSLSPRRRGAEVPGQRAAPLSVPLGPWAVPGGPQCAFTLLTGNDLSGRASLTHTHTHFVPWVSGSVSPAECMHPTLTQGPEHGHIQPLNERPPREKVRMALLFMLD